MSTFFNRGAALPPDEPQFFGIPPGPFLPEPDEAEDLVVLLVLAEFTVGIAEDACVGVLDQEGQNALLPPTPLGDVVLFDQGILAMKGDRVKIQVKGLSAGQPEPAHGVEPASLQFRITGRGDPATVFGQERSLGGDVQSSEEGQPLVQHLAHDMAVTRRPKQFQGQQRSQGTAGRDHLRSGKPRVSKDAIERDRGQHRQEEEQATELGPERPRAQVELPDVGDIRRGRPNSGWALIVRPARQPREPFFFEDLCDGNRTE